MLELMIVEDEAIIRDGLLSKIPWESMGLVPKYVMEDGADAMSAILAGARPDVVLSDIRMPGMDGLELAEWIAQSGYEDIRVILLSGYNDFDYARQALRSNVYDYLVKPLDVDELAACVARLRVAKGDEKAESLSIAQEIKRYIDKYYHKNIQLTHLAQQFYLNPSYISRMFSKEIGVSVVNYINGLRVQKAIELLHNTSLKVYEIASYVGMEDEKYFTRLFKKTTGVSPYQYREQHTAGESEAPNA